MHHNHRPEDGQVHARCRKPVTSQLQEGIQKRDHQGNPSYNPKAPNRMVAHTTDQHKDKEGQRQEDNGSDTDHRHLQVQKARRHTEEADREQAHDKIYQHSKNDHQRSNPHELAGRNPFLKCGSGYHDLSPLYVTIEPGPLDTVLDMRLHRALSLIAMESVTKEWTCVKNHFLI